MPWGIMASLPAPRDHDGLDFSAQSPNTNCARVHREEFMSRSVESACLDGRHAVTELTTEFEGGMGNMQEIHCFRPLVFFYPEVGGYPNLI